MNQIKRKHFYFVRHAETDWNLQKLCQGQNDIPLNKKGQLEAKLFAENCSAFHFECIVSSPLSRALETAKEIHHKHSYASFHIVSELSERNWGLLEGITSEEMYAIERLEEMNPSYSSAQGVESRELFRKRVAQGIAIAQTFHSHPLIISHGRVFVELCYLLDIPPIRQIKNCQLIKIIPDDRSWQIQII